MCSHTSAQPPKLGRQQRETQPNSCDQSSAPGTARGDTKLGVSHDERMGFSLMYVVASGDVPFTRNGQEWLTFGTDWLRKGASHPRAASRQRAVDPPSPLGDPSSVHRTISRLPLSPPALSTPPPAAVYQPRVPRWSGRRMRAAQRRAGVPPQAAAPATAHGGSVGGSAPSCRRRRYLRDGRDQPRCWPAEGGHSRGCCAISWRRDGHF